MAYRIPQQLKAKLSTTGLGPHIDFFEKLAQTRFASCDHGDLPAWQAALAALPVINPSTIDLNSDLVRIGTAADLAEAQRQTLLPLLRGFHPWRKGPFELFGIHIDTEWRSDWKWDRLAEHLEPLTGRLVLDVGCGSGYHCLRMIGAGAQSVIGIEPNILYVMQWRALRCYLDKIAADVLPLALEDLPANMQAFDTVFSMGVLHHRRSPFDHLFDLKNALRPDGQLVLETLVIKGKPGEVLVPPGRYAKMRNIWFIPSPATLEMWLQRAGFKQIVLIDETKTTVEEQRSTPWMTFESLPDFLDPENDELTIEGLPAPRRAVFLARR